MVVRRKRGTRPSRHARRASPEAITEVDSYSSDSSHEHLCDDDTDDAWSSDDSDSTRQPKKKKPRRAASGSATTTTRPAAAAAATTLRARPPPRTRRAQASGAAPVDHDDDSSSVSSSDSSSSSSDDDDDSVTTVSAENLNTACSVKGCDRVSRGKYGFCRKHGGGAKCRARGCRKFARVGGYCTKHGGFVRCTASGCRQRAVLMGLCGLHITADPKCTRPGCVMPAGEHQARTGLCSKHAPSSRECHHGGCLLKREGRKGKWCAGHTAAKRLLELKLGREAKQQAQGGPATRCRHFLPGKAGICGAKALRASERCPTHQLLSTCGTVGCHFLAQREGKCAPHANLDQCSADCCFRVASRQGPRRLPVCGVHAHWKNVCTSKGCRSLVFRQGAACCLHQQDTKLQATHMAARLMASPSARQAARTLLDLAMLNLRPRPQPSEPLITKEAPTK